MTRRIKLLVDGREEAALKRGQDSSIQVSPGPHTLQAALDWTRSRSVYIDVPDGEIVDCVISLPAESYWKIWVKPQEALDVQVDGER